MKLNSPSLVLSFSETPLSGNPAVQTIGSTDIVNRSVRIHQQLLNGLRSSSNQLTLQLSRKCPSIEDIIASDSNILTVLMEGSEILFTGYLSTNWTWVVTSSGEQNLNITIEDIGTRLLERPFIQSGRHLLDCAVDDAITAICSSCGITASSSRLRISSHITKVIEASETCRTILEQMLYEVGFAYYFDNLGELKVFEIACDSTEGIPVLDNDDLVVVGTTAINLSKSIRQYRSSRVSFSEIGRASDYLIYSNNTERGDSNPHCNLTLAPGEHFDGTEIYTPEKWALETADEFREPAQIEACNASSETDIVGSGKIIAVSNVQPDVEKGNGLTCSISASGGPFISIEAHNPTTTDLSFTKIDAYADIMYEKSTEVVRTGAIISDGTLDEELSFVHDRALASRHANLLADYYKYCSSKYTFCSKEDINLGTIVRLHDDVFSGLDVNVLLVARNLSDASDVISYIAVGISVFDLNRDIYHRTTDRQKISNKGKDGSSFTVVIESSDGSVFRLSDNLSTSLSCRVFRNTTDITDLLEEWRFHWYRKSGDLSGDERWNTSSKAIGHKSVHLSNEDVFGRSVFSCEVELGETA